MNKPRKSTYLINDIFNSIKAIDSYIRGVNYNEFETNQEKIDAVVNRLNVIGQTSQRLMMNEDQAFNKTLLRTLKLAYKTRNVLSHDYELTSTKNYLGNS
ncbi:HepT-like ribonuclease domain-containing protein [Endozoicomonas sp. ONNA1]|uniref:HepT-like ribonuclease domain-containing protein n=1 Tax=Endozoicomonas sp. ONNA1 TaxID=2828740 RepID=UPI002147F4D6|nr:HepT-like ribonuclease domain-containing protein [Endozoicomonas sp. ONNA1]